MAASQGWKLVNPGGSSASYLEKSFTFNNFISAFSFMTQIALESEKRDHHPDWNNVYNRLVIKWSTHTANGVTEKDHDMANVCDRLYESSFTQKK